MDYQKLYLHLFNAVTDALEELSQMNFGKARADLIAAQQECEELYISGGDEEK